jgi:hypothetical protein
MDVGVVGAAVEEVVRVDHKLVLEAVVVVVVVVEEEVVAAVGEVVVRVGHKLVLEVFVAAVEVVAVEEVAALAVGRTLLQGLLETVRVRICLQPVPGTLPVRPKRESSAPQTLAPGEARARRT